MTSLARKFQEFQANENLHAFQYNSAVARLETQDPSVAYPVMAPSHTEYHTGIPQNAELANYSERD